MDEISDWTHDLARRLHVRAPVETTELQKLFAAEDFAGLVGAIKRSFGLELKMELGRVKSGGCPTAPAWIKLPEFMPLYGTEAFRRTTVRVFIREEFMRWMPFPTLVSAIAHEMAHVVLESRWDPLRENEKVVDLTAMLFGFSELYFQGATYQAGRGNTVGYLSLQEVRYAASLMAKLRRASRQAERGSKFSAPYFLTRLRPRQVVTGVLAVVGLIIALAIAGRSFEGARQANRQQGAENVAQEERKPADAPLSAQVEAVPNSVPLGSEAITTSIASALSSAPTHNVNRTEDVRAIQERLFELGYLLKKPDGFWGPRSQQALHDFRLSAKLVGDSWDRKVEIALFDPASPRAMPQLRRSRTGSAPQQ
jgi:hypothetical protein